MDILQPTAGNRISRRRLSVPRNILLRAQQRRKFPNDYPAIQTTACERTAIGRRRQRIDLTHVSR